MQITDAQIKGAAAAVVEVLNGASTRRTLALVDQLALAKQILTMVAAGQLIIGNPAPPPKPAEDPPP